MKYLFTRQNLETLEQVAWSRTLLAFDFDGTLAPIVHNRETARMRAATRPLFEEACRLFPTAVVSGRSAADVAARLGAAKVRFIVGNHGLETGAPRPRSRAGLQPARELLERLVRTTPGLDLEDKQLSLTVHYRRSRRKRSAEQTVRAAVGRLRIPMRIIPGKCVLNIVPLAAPTKGDAVLSLRRRLRLDTAIYVGDDVTDEDVFLIDQPGRLLTVRVGNSRRSAAHLFIRTQREIDGMLRALIHARRRGMR